ncbi:AraC family transcriptional regulator [Paenibacillus sp. BIHB 4019]|uniref:AraC family transcriptional regulator n=1 Tax=Paenibacillus sp. BIHB 4019 TaxID=1870819 RepID=A0A1B2DNP8_9BACL|nr:AraC family transcriptional regulator [Paenibacillus sp. BIHB 4019]ANY69338.1 AraC family transcriptional regulator [Paenibacillus sp. BIHB 4019]
MTKRYIPVLTELDRELPYYVVQAGQHWLQENVIRPQGYLYQWIQCVEGEGELIVEGKVYRVKEGMAMLLFQGVPHEYYAVSSSWIVDWIVFDGHQVQSFLNRIAGISASGVYYVSRPEALLARIRNVLDIGQSNAGLKGIQCSGVMYSLLTDIVQYASVLPNHSATSLNFKLKPLFDYMEQNFRQPLTLEILAEVIDVTPQHLCTVFKKTTGIRIFQYIHSVRIKKSKELLLQHSQMQVKEIAYLSGFEDANYFCSVFKKLEQITPSQYRNIHF